MMDSPVTTIGTPITVMKWIRGRWEERAGIIVGTPGTQVSIMLYSDDRASIIENMRHEDFKMEGEDFWKHINP